MDFYEFFFLNKRGKLFNDLIAFRNNSSAALFYTIILFAIFMLLNYWIHVSFSIIVVPLVFFALLLIINCSYFFQKKGVYVSSKGIVICHRQIIGMFYTKPVMNIPFEEIESVEYIEKCTDCRQGKVLMYVKNNSSVVRLNLKNARTYYFSVENNEELVKRISGEIETK